MKILLITNCAFNEGLGSGYGIVNFYMKGLRSKGIVIDAYEPDQYESFRFIRPYANSYRQAFGMMLLAIRKLLLGKYDAVVFYGAESFAAVWLIKHIFPKTIVINHSNGIENHSIDVLRNKFGYATIDNAAPKWYQFNRYNVFLSAFKNSDFVITNGQYDIDYLLERKILPAEKMAAIEYGLNKDYLGLNFNAKNVKVIGYCGTWIARKGVDILQHDVNLFLTEHPDYVFYIIGCGNSFQKEEFFDKPVLDRIVVFPFVADKKELMGLYLKIKYFLFPSYYDSFGLVLSEAMSCGCSVITTNTGYAYSLTHKENCYKIENEKGELNKALNDLILNEELSNQIAYNGYRHVQQLNWDNKVEALHSVIKGYVNHL